MLLTYLSYLYFLIHITVISSNVWNIKCHRTKLEEDLHDFTRNGSLIYLPKLETLKRKYPGDTFILSTDDGCQDLENDCQYLAERGQCTGADSEAMITSLMFLVFIEYHIQSFVGASSKNQKIQRTL